MTVAYKLIRETFTQPRHARPAEPAILVEYLDGPFSRMENRWSFQPVERQACDVEFFIDYEFRSRMLGMLMGAMFDAAFRRFAAAFETARRRDLRRKPATVSSGRARLASARSCSMRKRLQHRVLPHLGAADIAEALLAMNQPARRARPRRNAPARPAFPRPPPGPAMPVTDTARSAGECAERAARHRLGGLAADRAVRVRASSAARRASAAWPRWNR